MNRRNFLRGTVSVMAMAAVLKFSEPRLLGSGVAQSPPRNELGGPVTYKGPIIVGETGGETIVPHPAGELVDTVRYGLKFREMESA